MEIGTKEQPNIIFIVIDALRVKNMGCYGYPRGTTPNIDALAEKGVLFQNCYSCANATDPSLTAMFSGRYPLSIGLLHHGASIEKREIEQFRKREVKLLPMLLKTYGYRTIGLDWLDRWHREGYDYYESLEEKPILLRGLREETKGCVTKILSFFPSSFQIIKKKARSLIFRPRLRKDEGYSRFKVYKKTPPTVRDLEYTKKAIEFIRKAKTKFFLMIHYWSCHAPYNPPEAYIPDYPDARGGETVDEMLQNIRSEKWRSITEKVHVPLNVKYIREIEMRYDGTISFVDDLVGRLVKAIQDLGMWENTLLILTSDHGDSITEHGVYLDHHSLYEEIVRVPLIITGKNFPRGRVIKSFVQHTDLVPTILDYLGEKQENFSHFLDGKSLLPLLSSDVSQLHDRAYVTDAFTKFRIALRTPKYKYIYSPTEKSAICRHCKIPHREQKELYDLTIDPEEKKNIINENEELSSDLEGDLLKWVEKTVLEGEKERIIKKVKELKLSKRI